MQLFAVAKGIPYPPQLAASLPAGVGGPMNKDVCWQVALALPGCIPAGNFFAELHKPVD